MSAVVSIVVNGQPREVPDGSTVAALLAALGLDPRRVAVERNREIAPRAHWDRTPVQPGDHIEVVEFVGGG